MLALDTNVLVRYLAQDDARQSALANHLLEERLSPAQRGFVSLVTLLETVWVMESRYGADAEAVAGIVADLLDTPTLEVQDAPAVRLAMQLYGRGGVDLHDCLIVALAQGRGARVVTFDVKAARKLGMDLLR
ncbi:MAG: type II toxin-antitoxin system VapC family toxin [Rubrivivax sp.]|nr:type II toxin-antitoxin system VapC family toxin [Rubrivivax sp.]